MTDMLQWLYACFVAGVKCKLVLLVVFKTTNKGGQI